MTEPDVCPMEDAWRKDPTPTDKVTAHSYMRVYDKLLGHRRAEPLVIVEVGVLKGGSLALWRRLFHNAEITGVDIDEKTPDVDGCTVVHGDSRDAGWVKDYFPPESIDVLIDDGSHVLSSQVSTFWAFQRAMKKGGLYFIEDIYPFVGVRTLQGAAGIRPTELFDLREVKGRIDDVLLAIHF